MGNIENQVKEIDITLSSDLEQIIDIATLTLQNDGVILTPTDTVYGLLCLPQSVVAIDNIFKMKKRPLNTRLPIIVSNKTQARMDLPIIWNDAAEKLADKYWPGPLTIACGIKDNNLQWLSGRIEAAIRVPNYSFIQALAKKNGPLLMTSANLHGKETPHTVKGAMNSLNGFPDLIINGGVLSGDPSTLVNVNLPIPVVEREGVLSINEVKEVLNER